MVELARYSLADQLGGDVVEGAGVTVRVVEPVCQMLVSGAAVPPAGAIEGDDPQALWLAPDRVLMLSDTRHFDPDPAAFASDVTDGMAVFAISGVRAADLVAMGCTLDPDGPVLAPGRAARTLFAGVPVILYRRDGGFRVHVDRPVADFLMGWFRQAAASFGDAR